MPSVSEIELFKVLAGDSVDLNRFTGDANYFKPSQTNHRSSNDDSQNQTTYSQKHAGHDRDQEQHDAHDTNKKYDSYNDNRRDHRDHRDHRDYHDHHDTHRQMPADQYAENRNSYDSYKQEYGEDSLEAKRAALYEYRSLIQLHPELVPRNRDNEKKEFTMDDSLQSIVFEIERLRSVLDVNSNLSLIESGLGFGVFGIEMFMTKLKIVNLEGWSKSIQHQPEKFRPVLLKIYRRIFRRGLQSVNPFVELAILLVTSAFAYSREKPSLNTVNQSFDTHQKQEQPNLSFNDFDSDSEDEMEGPSGSSSSSGYRPTAQNNNAGGMGGGMGLLGSLLPMLMPVS